MDDDKLKTIITETIEEFFENNIMATLLGLLKASEQRIDETNRMIQRMSEISSNYTDVYGKHLSSLEQSRDKALDCSSEARRRERGTDGAARRRPQGTERHA